VKHMATIHASAPGKVIISGEHSVVYGYPALVTSVDLYANVKVSNSISKSEFYPISAKDILKRTLQNYEMLTGVKLPQLKLNLISDIPQGCGMGSSAAVSVASVAAFSSLQNKGKLNKNIISKVSYESEKYYHGNPSGVDIAISMNGGILWYRKESENLKLLSKINVVNKLDNLVLINSGQAKESTSEMVRSVATLYSRFPEKIDAIFKNIEKVTRGLLKYVTQNESIPLSELLKDNQRLLEILNLVSPATTEIVKEIEKIGGAAKISGAGGKKGKSGILLAYHPDKEKLLAYTKKKNLDVIDVRMGVRGVKIEKND